MVREMQCINARSAGEKCKAGMVRADGKGTSLPLIHRMFFNNHSDDTYALIVACRTGTGGRYQQKITRQKTARIRDWLGYPRCSRWAGRSAGTGMWHAILLFTSEKSSGGGCQTNVDEVIRWWGLTEVS